MQETETHFPNRPAKGENEGQPDHADVMTFLTRFVDAATKLTSESDVGDVLELEGRDNVAAGPSVDSAEDAPLSASNEEENQGCLALLLQCYLV